MTERETGIVEDALRKHVEALTLDIGPRTPFMGDSLARAAADIQSVFEDAGAWPAPPATLPLAPRPSLN